MTQEQIKAKELVDKFYNINKLSIEDNGTNHYISRIQAKQCALIAVDLVLDKDGYNNDFWRCVKQEILAL